MRKILKFNESIENDQRLSKAVLDILNKQIKNELESSQIYRGMCVWLDDKGWIQASKYFFKSAQEELKHMDKIYEYVFDKNCLAVVPTIGEVKQEFTDIREILELSLQHEIEVTKMWEEIAELSKKEKDNTTYSFAKWFLDEQVEEENKFRELLFKMNLDIPKWELEDVFEELLK